MLEGFDFGVGMLMGLLSRGDRADKDRDRRVMINTIGPVWDGNEVWLLTAGGATFAAFPEWYATMFSGFYLPLLLILLALIVRGVAFEYRGKIDDPRWAGAGDGADGRVLGAGRPLGRGVRQPGPRRRARRRPPVRRRVLGLLNPFALLGGADDGAVFLTHGAVFLALKTDGDFRARARTFAARSSVVTLVVAGAWAVWTQVAYSVAWTWAAVVVAAGALVVLVVAAHAPAARAGRSSRPPSRSSRRSC